jgi:hypothetical protein
MVGIVLPLQENHWSQHLQHSPGQRQQQPQQWQKRKQRPQDQLMWVGAAVNQIVE